MYFSVNTSYKVFMNNFTYFTPTKVVFGKDTHKNVGELVKEENCKMVLLHYGSGSVVKSGLLDSIKEALNTAGVSFVELGGVVPNPRLSLVYEGIKLAKENSVDFVLAIGGGSVIDSAKAIGYGVANPSHDVWDFYDKKAAATACLPIGVVLTIAASGSEMSDASVITNEQGWLKRSYNTNLARPKFAILNPELTMSLPRYQTLSGCTDIIMHTMERYFTSGGNMDLTDGFAEHLMTTVMKNALILKDDPMNYEARAEVMWAGSLSHNGLTGCGIQSSDFATHLLEHELGGLFDVAHGAGLAALWGSWARYVYKECLHRFYKYAVRVMNIPEDENNQEAVALAGIEATERFFKQIDMPISIPELGVTATDEQLVEMAKKCAIATGGQKGSAKILYEADMLEVYKAANVARS